MMRVFHHLAAPGRGAVILATLAALSACATAPTDLSGAAPFGPLPGGISAFLEDGPWPVDVLLDSFESEYGCTVSYEQYRPKSASGASDAAGHRPLVVLAHGFLRNLEQMRGWASHWASYGVESVVLSFCNSGVFRGNHDRNADDLIAAAELLAGPDRPIIYAGYSAGGLSALLATAADERSVAYLGLDPVDSGDLAAGIGALEVPALYLHGEPDRCNADNNMIPVTPPSSRRLALRARFATHCDFEAPTDDVCVRLCGEIVPEEMEVAVRNTIRAVSDAWIFEHAGILPEGALSESLVDQLAAAGRIVRVSGLP